MFLGLAVFIILAIAAAILVIRTIKALFRRLTGNKEGHGHNALKEDGKKKSEQEDRAEKESEEKSQQETKDRAEDPEEEFVHQRHEWALADGITEDFSTNDTSGKSCFENLTMSATPTHFILRPSFVGKGSK